MMNCWQVIMPPRTGLGRRAEHHGKGMVHGFEGNRRICRVLDNSCGTATCLKRRCILK